VTIRHQQGDLLRRPQSREEAKLIVVAYRLTPIGMKPRDERLRFLNGKGVEARAIFLRDSQTFQAGSGIVFLWVILVAVVVSAANYADGVVIGLFRPLVEVCDFGQFSVAHLVEDPRSNLGQICALAVTNARSLLATRESHSARNSSKTWSQVRRVFGAATFFMNR
jgi:hypothetical protein